MKAKVTIYSHRVTKNGHQLIVRLSEKKKKKYYFTKVFVQPTDWDYTNSRLKFITPVAPDHPGYERYTNYKKTKAFIHSKQNAYEQKIEELARSGRPFSFDKVIQLVENPVQEATTFFTFIEAYAKEMEDDDRIQNAAFYKEARARVSEFTKKRDMMFYEMDDTFLLDFRKYLTKKGNADSTISKILRTIRAAYNEAIRRGIARQNDYPFKKNKQIMVGLTRHSYKSRSISKHYIDKLRQLELKDRGHEVESLLKHTSLIKMKLAKKKNKTPGQIDSLKAELKTSTIHLQAVKDETNMWHARNYFMVGYLGNGINFTDIARINWASPPNDWSDGFIRDGRVHFVRFKTRRSVKTLKSFAINQELQLIFDYYRWYWRKAKQLNNPYVFPIFNGYHAVSEKRRVNRIQTAMRQVNKSLKLLGDMIDAPIDLTTYVWRHSRARVMVDNGATPMEIQQTLDHQTILTTQHYLKQFDHKELDKALAYL